MSADRSLVDASGTIRRYNMTESRLSGRTSGRA
jgi:hypothetical protein